jgi:peptidoglycan biosynthesis protein MviN/MurJ (putative lipid II flippase)
VSPPASERPAGFLRSAGIISLAVAASRVTGLVRESVLSGLFGAGAVFDAYVLGYRIPNLARDLFAEGALASAFVPTFSRYLATKTKEEARALSDITGTLLLAITALLSILGMIFSPVFVEIFASGFHAAPGKFELAVQLVRIMSPFLVLIALSGQAQGILYACHRFGVPAISLEPVQYRLGCVRADGGVLARAAYRHYDRAGHGDRDSFRRRVAARVPVAQRLAGGVRVETALEPAA